MMFCRTVRVAPKLPEEINRLNELAFNLYFSWDNNAINLFKSIDPELWERVYHNPVKFLLQVTVDDLQKAAADEQYLKRYRQTIAVFDEYMHAPVNENHQEGYLTAYFSAEFGLHESFPTYSGGLGLLAGDHCKAASDLGLPFVGVGLLYKHGYFNQLIDKDGKQEAEYKDLRFNEMPITPALDSNGQRLTIAVQLPGRQVFARIWHMQVGRISVYLLDADLPENSPEDREITGQLYGGGQDMRMCMEILLGIGGVKALRALNLSPTVWHINEGHAAFLLVERLRELVEDKGLSVGVALEVLKADTIFTTHTPVPAGHDIFNQNMVDRYFNHFYYQLRLTKEQFMQLGQGHSPGQEESTFNMTLLALKQCGFCNGVSRLHGAVTRSMFHYLYPDMLIEEVPVHHVTNGVHTRTWLAPEMSGLFKKYLGADFDCSTAAPEDWERIINIPNRELWEVHMALKEKMILTARATIAKQKERNRETLARIKEAEKYLNPEVLTIGFARRFATYKRAGLLFKDRDRLAALVNDPKYPVQLVFAGKAHPADLPGQELIKLINDAAADERFRGKIVFLENYDINISRYLLQGVDVWLNTPRRPMEASGTSGMKAAVNGVLNCSVFDGWWPEAFNGKNGFAIGSDRDFPDDESTDLNDFSSLYELLTEAIIPLYYKQIDKVPEIWLSWMKESIKTIAPYFSTRRMVSEYEEGYYRLAHQRNRLFSANGYQVSYELAELKNYLRVNWQNMQINSVTTNEKGSLNQGEAFTVNATVDLGSIPKDKIVVELVYREITDQGVEDLAVMPLTEIDNTGEISGKAIYAGEICLPQGSFNYTVRVRPNSSYFAHHFELPLVCWAPLG